MLRCSLVGNGQLPDANLLRFFATRSYILSRSNFGNTLKTAANLYQLPNRLHILMTAFDFSFTFPFGCIRLRVLNLLSGSFLSVKNFCPKFPCSDAKLNIPLRSFFITQFTQKLQKPHS